jgi:hypothetical protein
MLDKIQFKDLDYTIDLREIYKLRSQQPNLIKTSSRGGWASDKLTTTQAPQWAGSILSALGSIECFWFNINPPGAANAWHLHHGIKTSGVVYLQAPNKSGNIVFRHQGIEVSVEPRSGLCVEFPGLLEHSVQENASTEDRLCLVYNRFLLARSKIH